MEDVDKIVETLNSNTYLSHEEIIKKNIRAMRNKICISFKHYFYT